MEDCGKRLRAMRWSGHSKVIETPLLDKRPHPLMQASGRPNEQPFLGVEIGHRS